ncbi:MAG: hypothetical protein Q3976_09890 [Corynebacterium sp.]|nr:hypothetical protein [Corynebacterium sp.]
MESARAGKQGAAADSSALEVQSPQVHVLPEMASAAASNAHTTDLDYIGKKAAHRGLSAYGFGRMTTVLPAKADEKLYDVRAVSSFHHAKLSLNHS